MKVKSNGFNKKIFIMLLEKARGSRTTRKFAEDCKISYVQLHKLEMGLQDNPPGRQLLIKLAENSEGGVELEDYLFACGVTESEKIEEPSGTISKKGKSLDIQSLYERLSRGQQKTVYDFVDYLLNYKKQK